MCRVDLNHTTQPCGHRWYHLLSSCTATSTLATCSSRLAIDGWEIKCDFCPFCAGWDVSSDDFLILGTSSRHNSTSGGSTGLLFRDARQDSLSSRSSVSSGDMHDDARFRGVPMGVPLSRQPSLAVSVSGARRASRASSFAGSDGAGVVTAAAAALSPAYDAGPVLGASEKNLNMNARIHGYIDELPELAAKSSSRRSKSKFRKSRAAEKDEDEGGQDFDSSAWKRRSKSIVDLVRRR